MLLKKIKLYAKQNLSNFPSIHIHFQELMAY